MLRIPLTNKAGDVIDHAVVDDEDAGLLQYRWHLIQGYAYRAERHGRKMQQYAMHREILGLGPGDPEVDHWNLDKLDNRRCNLRPSTRALNNQNTTARKGARSKYRGVSFHKKSGKWQARVRVNGELHHLGLHPTEEEAFAACQRLHDQTPAPERVR